MRQRGAKLRYPDRPTQRFRSHPRGPSNGRFPSSCPRMVIRAAALVLRTDPRRI
jgi:hypothetical protein